MSLLNEVDDGGGVGDGEGVGGGIAIIKHAFNVESIIRLNTRFRERDREIK